MNAERLLACFNLIGDEPETVQQFRKLVVGLALSGKLTAGEVSTDVATLVSLIEERKGALVQEGQLRKQNPTAKVTSEDLPKAFSSPEIFVRLGSVARVEKGLTGITKAKPGP